jgi:putative transposase
MNFESGFVYHVYNQGNNSEPIFFEDDNYLFFLKKMRTYLSPYADLLCYCLMPNHFHWLVYVRHAEINFSLTINSPGDSKSPGEFIVKPKSKKPRTFNNSIAILLRSYTRAINKQQDRSGALFREGTKAKTGWIDEFITVDRYRNGPNDFRAFPDDEYGWHCFNYIHQNPVAGQIVTQAIDWEYSSSRDYAGFRNGTLCNQVLAKELLRLP